MTAFYDAENNFNPPSDLADTGEGRTVITQMNKLRLDLAAEFMRCKVYGMGGIDSALDDADTALGFLDRIVVWGIPQRYAGVYLTYSVDISGVHVGETHPNEFDAQKAKDDMHNKVAFIPFGVSVSGLLY